MIAVAPIVKDITLANQYTTSANQPTTMTTLKTPELHTITIYVCTVILSLVILAGCVSNLLVFITTYHNKRPGNTFSILVLNLAIADFLMCSVLAPMFLYQLVDRNPPKTLGFCCAQQMAGTATAMVSLCTLDIIAMLRIYRVTKHRKWGAGVSKVLIALVFTWIAMFIYGVLGTMYAFNSWNETFETCYPVISGLRRGRHDVLLFFWTPPIGSSLVLITCAYIFIAGKVCRQINKRYIPSLHSNNSNKRNFWNIDGLRKTESQRTLSQTRGGKALAMCFLVPASVLCCWSPLIVSHIVEHFTGESTLLFQIKICSVTLIFLMSAINPIIYAHQNIRLKAKPKRYKLCELSSLICWPTKTLKTTRTRRDINANGTTASPQAHGTSPYKVISVMELREHGHSGRIDRAVGPSVPLEGRMAYTPTSNDFIFGDSNKSDNLESGIYTVYLPELFATQARDMNTTVTQYHSHGSMASLTFPDLPYPSTDIELPLVVAN